ncbi:uncharacterized protein LOC107465694 [Arachis duranensis]|uniref:Uncharacterized protein LOC107465694 n=1 Tax=Arachis duranensis TaxID=130453 RepID=A0A6P4BHY1_ARADU|nr:uncharacterized protein LOC107465694 [Arachis duranensis]
MVYQLLGEARNLWQGECHLLQLQNADIPWDIFQTAFYKKCFPKSVREARELELMQLKQALLSMAEYTSRFEELCKFSRVSQGAPETYESSKCIKYQGGLRDAIMTAVAPLEIRIFFELVNKERVMEECPKKVAIQRDTCGENNNCRHKKYFQPRAQNFKRGVHVPQGQGNFRRPTFDPYHPVRGRGDCFNCGSPGHMARDCTRGRNPNAGRNQHQGRVFTVNASDAAKADPFIRGRCIIGYKALTPLCDIGTPRLIIAYNGDEDLILKCQT